MTRLNASRVDQIQFRTGDSQPTQTMKLEMLRKAVVEGQAELVAEEAAKVLYVSIVDGLPDADPAEPLLRVRMREDAVLGDVVADAGDAATGTVAFRLLKDGADNGDISFTGTVGTGTITDPSYPAGSLLELYPPVTADATLDDVSISIPVTVS